MSSTQQDFRVRTYMLLNTLEYVRDTPTTEGILSQLPPEVMRAAAELAPAAWCPGDLYVEVLRKVATAAGGDQALAQELLIAAGTHVARTATNTFLRLLMKMLTPSLFAKKLPDFWKRDCSIGRLEVEVAPPKIVCHFIDMPGFDHASCAGAGFVSHAFEAMGKPINKVELSDWSLTNPCPKRSSVALTWAE